MRLSVWIAPLLAVGCAGPLGDPLVEAHRGAAGYWPQNSRSAMLGTIAADFEGLELDLVLTRDGQAVLSHDPWLDPAHCTDAEGRALPGRIRIDELELEALQADYLCGGLADPEFPNAEVIAEPLMSFPELILALRDASAGMRIHLDLKVEPGWAPPAEEWLEPVFDTWWAADMPQTIVVTASSGEPLAVFEDHARLLDRDLHTLATFPIFPIDAPETGTALAAERDFLLGKVDYVQLIEDSGSDGIAVYYEIAEKGQLLAARDAGYEVALWTLNTTEALDLYSRWPVDVLITDYPGAEP